MVLKQHFYEEFDTDIRNKKKKKNKLLTLYIVEI